MRDPKRIDKLLVRLARVSKQMPDMRLGQIVQNTSADVFYIEDEDLISRIEARAMATTEKVGRKSRLTLPSEAPDMLDGEAPDCK